MGDFFDAIRRFLLDYLPKQRCLSKNTILSYRQTLNIFVAYMRDEIGIGAAELTFSRVDRDVILNFLTWLEKARGCSVSTRNQRLMALRSFLTSLDKSIVRRRHCIFLPAIFPPRRLTGESLNS